MLVELKFGAIAPPPKALCIWIIFIAWVGSGENQRIQCDTFEKGTEFASLRRPSLVILPQGTRMRKTDNRLIIYTVSFFPKEAKE